jgi:adenosylmethionine-8-amino-7-oxononanoate aminotransferase
VPVGAVLTKKRIADEIFDRMNRSVVRGSTFATRFLDCFSH